MESSQKPLLKVLHTIDRFNSWVGELVSRAVLLMVILTFVVVVLRYFFRLGWVWMQEIVIYLHGIVFLLAVPITLIKDGHVRVDIFYRDFDAKKKAWINLIGAAVLLIPTCLLVFLESFPYVVDSWRVLEGSKDGGGLEAVFLLKTALLVFALLTLLQGLSLLGHSYLTLKGEHGE